MLKLKLAFIIF